MPKRPAELDLQPLIQEFVQRLVVAVETATTRRVQNAVLGALGGNGSGGALALPRRRGRPPKNPLLAPMMIGAPAKRRQKQLCPVPGCTNPAAPVFGMVCAKHKDVPKAQIKKYRADRRAAKARDKGGKARAKAA